MEKENANKELLKNMQAVIHDFQKESKSNYLDYDFKIDKQILKTAKEGETFLWLVRDTGTYFRPLNQFILPQNNEPFMNPQLGTKRLFLIEKGKADVQEVSWEQAKALNEKSLENSFSRFHNGDVLALTFTDDAKRFFVKYPDSVVEVEKDVRMKYKGTQEMVYTPYRTLGKEQLFERLHEIDNKKIPFDTKIVPFNREKGKGMFSEAELKQLHDWGQVKRVVKEKKDVKQNTMEVLGR